MLGQGPFVLDLYLVIEPAFSLSPGFVSFTGFGRFITILGLFGK
jgi:hypothetical protein